MTTMVMRNQTTSFGRVSGVVSDAAAGTVLTMQPSGMAVRRRLIKNIGTPDWCLRELHAACGVATNLEPFHVLYVDGTDDLLCGPGVGGRQDGRRRYRAAVRCGHARAADARTESRDHVRGRRGRP